MDADQQFLRRLRIVGLIEAISTIALFAAALPLKYAWDLPVAVSIVGPVHGALFMLLVGMLVVGISRIPISGRLAAAGIVGAVFPAGPFVVDRWLSRLVERPDRTDGRKNDS